MWLKIVCIGFFGLCLSSEALPSPIARDSCKGINKTYKEILDAYAKPMGIGNEHGAKNASYQFFTACFDTVKLPNHIQRIQNLPSFLSESSALCETAEGIWSINDSHNPSSLYLLRRKAYELWRDSGKVILDGHFIQFDISVKNNDWEALETDGTYLYLGDFGNNRGNRRDLRIVKIPIQSLLHSLLLNTRASIDSIIEIPNKGLTGNQGMDMDRQTDSLLYKNGSWGGSNVANTRGSVLVVDCAALMWEEIRFSYPDQTNFEIRRMHNFDCEAMIIEEERIVLLSKNWKNLRCDIYALPKDSGVYVAARLGSFNPGFLVTDATRSGNRWYLCGYGPSGNQYIGVVNGLNHKGFSRKKLPIKPAQIEGIHYDARSKQFILSTEARKTQAQAILLLQGL